MSWLTMLHPSHLVLLASSVPLLWFRCRRVWVTVWSLQMPSEWVAAGIKCVLFCLLSLVTVHFVVISCQLVWEICWVFYSMFSQSVCRSVRRWSCQPNSWSLFGHELWEVGENIRSQIQAAEMCFPQMSDWLNPRRKGGKLWVKSLLLCIERSQWRRLGHLTQDPLWLGSQEVAAEREAWWSICSNCCPYNLDLDKMNEWIKMKHLIHHCGLISSHEFDQTTALR